MVRNPAVRRGIRIAQWVVMIVALGALIGNAVFRWQLPWVTTVALIAALLVVFSNTLMRQKPSATATDADGDQPGGGTVSR